MRVIAGTAKGVKLVRAPEGVRPVTDRVREGLFSSLADRVAAARVLDLYAGTGALGIEALSRGASEAVFVDRSPKALAAVRENLGRTGLREGTELLRSDALSSLDRVRGGDRRFDLVFLDPPYELAGPQLDRVLAALASKPMLGEGATVVLTRGSRNPTVVVPVQWVVARRLAYGDSVLTLLRSRNLPRTPRAPRSMEV